jgi:Mg2+-importing ATPase
MLAFGPISSVYDFLTFAVMIYGFDAGATLFRSGWFVESLATQTLVIFLIRTRRIPFFHSRPSRPLLATTLACATLGVLLPYSPLADLLGFEPLPLAFLAVLALMVVTYLALVELGKYVFFTRLGQAARPLALKPPHKERRIQRRATGWSLQRPSLPKRLGHGRLHPSGGPR